MECLICQSECRETFSTLILNKYHTKLMSCSTCNYSFFQKPTWLGEAYKESINLTDTGASQRSIDNSKLVSILLFFGLCSKEDDTFLDYGGGHGLFTRLMRDTGYSWRWFDPYTQNVLAKGFSEERLTQYELITSFETFEHFPDPLTEITKILEHTHQIFFSTELLPQLPPPAINDWSYYAPQHGQHIGFFHLTTLQHIAKTKGLNFYTNGTNIHFFTPKKSLKIKLIFKLFKNNKWARLCRELIFLYIKLLKNSKIIEDSQYLENQRLKEIEK